MASPAQSLPPANRLGPQKVLPPSLPEGAPGESLPEPAPKPPHWAGMVITTAGALGVGLGVLVVIGWHTGYLVAFRYWFAASLPVRYNAGLCFMLGGVALLLLARWRIALARLAGAVVALFGLVTACEYIFSLGLGIDELFFNSTRVAPSVPSRMAPNAAVCFLLMGWTLLVTSKNPSRKRNTLQAFTAALVAAVGLAGFIGYLADVPTAYAWGNFTPMAAPTAAALFVLGFGAVAFAWRQFTAHCNAIPPWSPLLAAMTVTAVSLALWQALHALGSEPAVGALTLAVGLLQAALFYLVLHLLRSTRERARDLSQLNLTFQVELADRSRAEQALRCSEERYRALLLATAQVVWTTPPDGLVEDMPMWREYTGQTLAEVRGWGWLNAVHPEDRERTSAIWTKAVKTRGLYETEYRIRRADGQYRHFAIRGVPVLEQDGSIREWVGICSDIHQRKQIEDELRKQAMLLNLAHDAIVVRDLQGHIRFWNRGAEETYGWTAEEASGRPIHELLQTQSAATLPAIEATVQEQGEWEGELQHSTRDGRTIVVASRWSLQRDHHDIPASILEINRDITERKRLEQELRAGQAYARSLIEASLDPLVTIAPDGKITDVNAATEAATGCSRQELIGSDFCTYFTEPGKARSGYQQVFAEGMVQDYPLAIRHRSGRVTEVLYNASVFRNQAGEVQGVFAAARDVTERKRLEDELRAKHAYTRSLIEASLDPLVTISADGKITDVNRATEEVTGCSRQELIGSDFSIYFTEPDKARVGYQQVFAEGLVEDYPLSIRHRSGRVIEVLYNASVFRNQAGEVEGVFAAARDITERKRLEDSLRQRTLELENSVAELETFSYSVSHDLRAPLRSIDGFSQILLEDYRDKVDAEGRDFLRRIRNASQNMAQLIDALLQLSRVMRSELRRESVDLSVLALSTAAMIQKAEPARQVRFRVVNGLQAGGDRRLLGVALQNLLQNAWKFSARNPEPTVEFGTTQKDGKTAYYVCDNGIGFDMAYVDKLFTPFQRLHAREQFEGTGIGLATVQRIIKRHGGKVWAEGTVGKGATFYFTLD